MLGFCDPGPTFSTNAARKVHCRTWLGSSAEVARGARPRKLKAFTDSLCHPTQEFHKSQRAETQESGLATASRNTCLSGNRSGDNQGLVFPLFHASAAEPYGARQDCGAGCQELRCRALAREKPTPWPVVGFRESKRTPISSAVPVLVFFVYVCQSVASS